MHKHLLHTVRNILYENGYTNVAPQINFTLDDYAPVTLSGYCKLDGQYKYLYLAVASLEELEETYVEYLTKEFPPIIEAKVRAFNEKMAELAEDAEKLGLDLPKFEFVAEMLRNHMKSNLLR